MPIYVAPYTKRESPKMGYSNQLITLDAFINETHSYTSSVMTHPVEQGASITDNIVNEPVELEIEAVISPYGIGSDDRNTPERADNAYRQLMQLHANKVPVRVYTGLVNYTNMAITSISIPRSKENSQTLRFTINFRKVRIVGKVAVEIDTFDESKTYWENTQGEGEDTSVSGFNASDKVAVTTKWGHQVRTIEPLATYNLETGLTIEQEMYNKELPVVQPDLPEINFRETKSVDNSIVNSNLPTVPIDKLFF